MTNYEFDQTEELFKLLLTEEARLKQMYESGRLQITKEALFVLERVFNNESVDESDLVLYNNDVLTCADIYRELKSKNERKKEPFYDEIVNRYIQKIKGASLNLAEPRQTPENPTTYHHLYWMLVELGYEGMSYPKKHRWLGYIQGVLTEYGVLTIEEELELTRSIFDGK